MSNFFLFPLDFIREKAACFSSNQTGSFLFNMSNAAFGTNTPMHFISESFHLINRVRRIAAPDLLHSALNRIFRLLPVGVSV